MVSTWEIFSFIITNFVKYGRDYLISKYVTYENIPAKYYC
ncbi:hypothetical protein KL86DYS2_12672 [uncultured Dysgonomonas sp.]|uniref:Uncharacterized protein n=2 Tax=Bacteroidota TaxID=976 RepID=A0A654BIJ2_SPHMU|nr:hypothetical protein KL86DYS2_12672 [uncultured Dysgonomonas sp.]VXC80314.1 conserved hypothetical protein [Sphingobacterium multivorum]